ncbi:MAG: hypothetical protein EHM48_07450 [Planctomycetaceae bacterium]|nr:MAG: hypothetical protein EHM48_07450 [Planctomycetaceae bacterium]
MNGVAGSREQQKLAVACGSTTLTIPSKVEGPFGVVVVCVADVSSARAASILLAGCFALLLLLLLL